TGVQRSPTVHAAPTANAAQGPAATYVGPAPHSVPTASVPPTTPSSSPTPSSSVTAASQAGMPSSMAANVVAGAVPSQDPPLGAAPAEMHRPPASGDPQTHEEAAAQLRSHLLHVWQGLSRSEREHASQLIARFSAPERTAWLTELARLTVPEAIAHAR